MEKGAGGHLPESYRYSWFAGEDVESGGGFAVISKFPLVEKEFIPKSAGAFGAQKCGVKVGAVTIRLVNVHLNPAMLPKPFNRASAMHLMMMNNKTQVLEIRNILRHCEGSEPTVIAGDWNCFPSMAAYRQPASKGFIDAHLSLDPKAKAMPTWSMTVGGERLQARFDHVFHNGLLEAASFEVVPNELSDHALLNCVLRLKE